MALPTRALTLWQPWAWLVVNGYKPLENRPKGFSHKSFRGDFWVHAGAHRQQRTWDEAYYFTKRVFGDELANKIPRLDDPRLVFSAIIGRASVIDMMPAPYLCMLPDGWRMAGCVGFVLRNLSALATPVTFRGFQGFWNVPPTALEQLKEAA